MTVIIYFMLVNVCNVCNVEYVPLNLSALDGDAFRRGDNCIDTIGTLGNVLSLTLIMMIM